MQAERWAAAVLNALAMEVQAAPAAPQERLAQAGVAQAFMAAAAAAELLATRAARRSRFPAPMVAWAQSASSGPELLAPSRQLTRGICNA